jgi:FkbM family methyltransferase
MQSAAKTARRIYMWVNGSCTWGNSLRAPVVFEPTFKIPVQVSPVDDVLLELGISRVDFIKLDVEGAEPSALKGHRAAVTCSGPPGDSCGSAGYSHAALRLFIEGYR